MAGLNPAGTVESRPARTVRPTDKLMAIDFRAGPRALVDGLERAGYKVSTVLSDAGDPRKSLQIVLRNGIVVNWDRDSQSVWAEGSVAGWERVEAAIARFAPRRRGTRRRGKTLRRILLALLLLAVAAFTAWQFRLRTTPAETDGPPARAVSLH